MGLKRIYKLPNFFGIENLDTDKIVEKEDLEPAKVEGEFFTMSADNKESEQGTTLEEDLREIQISNEGVHKRIFASKRRFS